MALHPCSIEQAKPALKPVDVSTLVYPDKVHTSLYNDRPLFEYEMQKIFANTWVWVGHESEIPAKNTFKTAYVGLEPVIVTRDRKGSIHVLLNRCRHRAATVCEGKKGSARSFVCPYHGWGYSLDGQLRALPKEEQYEGIFNKQDYPLLHVRHSVYNGMIFATMNADIEPLSDFLGGAKKWIDLFMKQSGGYPMQVIGTHTFYFPGNWKIQLENTTDAYHFPVVHKSFMSSLDEKTHEIFDFLDGEGYVEDLGNGHSVMVMIPELVDLDKDLDLAIPHRFANLAQELRNEGHPEDAVRRMVRAVGGSGFNLNLFPNVACSMAFFRVLRPIAVDKTEIQHMALGGAGAPKAFNQTRLRLHEHFQGPMGFGTPDDVEAWERVQAGSKAGINSEWILINRGLARLVTSDDGNPKGSVCSETGMRAAYQKYRQVMTEK